jgi:hypothetical protein
MANSPTPKQKVRLGDASVDEINAAYAKIYPELVKLAHYYAGMVHIPFVNVDAMIDEHINTPEFKRQAVQIVADAVNAAEAVRDAKSAAVNTAEAEQRGAKPPVTS